MKIKKGDTVSVISGKDRGKTGKVLRVFTVKNKILVAGVNVVKKHMRPKRQGEKGEVLNVNRPLNASNVLYVCPSCHKGTRLGNRREGKHKIRYCAKCKKNV